jgi:hypothetical protein
MAMNSGELTYVDEAGPFDVEQWQRITDLLRATPSRRPTLRPLAANPGYLRADLPEWERIYWIAIWSLRESCRAAYRRIDDILFPGQTIRTFTALEGDSVRIDGVAVPGFVRAELRYTLDDVAGDRDEMGRGTAETARPARPGLFARALRRLGR